MFEGFARVHRADSFHAVADGVGCAVFFCGGWQGDVVGRCDCAAAVDEFGVDLAGLGCLQGQCQSVLGAAVVWGDGVVSDEESVADGHSAFGQRTGQCCDGCCVWFGLPGFLGLGGVNGEEDAGGAGVVGEVVGDCGCVPESAFAVGEVDSECCADAVGVQGDAHEAFVRPEAEGVSDETEDIGRGFDGERFHGPSPSATGGHRMCLSDFGVVLIHGVTAGCEGPECNLGNREWLKVS